jgi:hypothetical protein
MKVGNAMIEMYFVGGLSLVLLLLLRQKRAAIVGLLTTIVARLRLFMLQIEFHSRDDNAPDPCDCRGGQQHCPQCSYTVNADLIILTRLSLLLVLTIAVALRPTIARYINNNTTKRLVVWTMRLLALTIVAQTIDQSLIASLSSAFVDDEPGCRDDDCGSVILVHFPSMILAWIAVFIAWQ